MFGSKEASTSQCVNNEFSITMENSEDFAKHNVYNHANIQQQGTTDNEYTDASFTYANESASTDQNNYTAKKSCNAYSSYFANGAQDSYERKQQDQNSIGDQNLSRELQSVIANARREWLGE